MTDTEKIYQILKDLTDEDFSDKGDTNLFETGLLDSMATVQLLLEIQTELNVDVPVSEFERSEWATPNKIIAKVQTLK
ncbi:D-alanine--poly(phosphoribitol) ligase subunit DltC [Lapidilactobacillus bayanensis]|uniref:D-alanine--poly(phosphoribitol) ligase subunit DltC n=1 Tax=Lapidilactobacillus bayanensis TaxID=2485998 RepID=UPI000F772784|nr:D-alanine--poly(phosphoribitol) ligase subunit DltC [Lapidilactobacillus bayanensis]